MVLMAFMEYCRGLIATLVVLAVCCTCTDHGIGGISPTSWTSRVDGSRT